MNQIVCLSTANWHPFPSRKQQVMMRLHDCEVLYFDPPVTLLSVFRDRSLKPRLTAFRAPGERIEGHANITVYALPPVLPFYNKFRWINRLNQLFLSRYVKKRMHEHDFASPVIWAYSPTSCDILPHLPARRAVYDCVDRHAGYPGFLDPKVVNRMERELAEACDMVFATADGLYETLSAYNPDTHMIPNGANYELFSQARRTDLPVPEDVRDIRGPVVGFVGMLQPCIDYDLIRALAKARPDCTVVLIGKPLPGADLSALDGLPNVRRLGLQPQTELPAYLARFDVCINPFRAGSLSKDVSPLKFYEYLATGKPIVTTPQPEQVLAYRDAVYVADGPESFVARCGEALSEAGGEMRERRLAYARACSWDARVAQIEDRLVEKKILTRSAL